MAESEQEKIDFKAWARPGRTLGRDPGRGYAGAIQERKSHVRRRVPDTSGIPSN
jgi:hypothetical protein